MTRNRFAATHLTGVALALQLGCGGGDAAGPNHTPTSIEANSSTIITAPAGTAALERPSVLVRDENGDPLAGVTVQFAVTSGDGSLTGATAKTASDGTATVSNWTLGATAATNTVDATVTGLPSVTFTANAGDPCQVNFTHNFGTTSSGSLGLADCQVSDGSFIDFWSVALPSTGTYLFTETSNVMDSYLLLLTPDLHVIAQNDDAAANTKNSRIKAILPASNFVIGANSFSAIETGPYVVASAADQSQVTDCEDVFVAPGIATDQNLQTTDCNLSGFLSDDFIIFLNTGQKITVTMTSPAIDPYLELYSLQGSAALVASNDDADGTTKNSSLTYTAPNFGYYFVKARTTSTGTTGAYTLTIQ
ncbi:MAG TPA: hypothetical protein VJ852_09700 [Gemmatimonadaceae bacterium]|nr:hypothetical protein [Gemmatimonadaceae bacterium]